MGSRGKVLQKLKHFLKSSIKYFFMFWRRKTKDKLRNQSVCKYNLQHAGYGDVITSGFTVI